MPRRFAPKLFLTISQKVKLGGEGGIRTHGTFPHGGFQDRCLKPLGHLSLAEEGYLFQGSPACQTIFPREIIPKSE